METFAPNDIRMKGTKFCSSTAIGLSNGMTTIIDSTQHKYYIDYNYILGFQLASIFWCRLIRISLSGKSVLNGFLKFDWGRTQRNSHFSFE